MYMLREKLSQWLEKRNQSLDDFKHLKCFGVLGPVVRRPHTPFRKTMLSTSTLKAIPESKETTPNKDPSQARLFHHVLPRKCTCVSQCMFLQLPLSSIQGSSENIASPPDELNTTFTLEDEDKENIPDIARDEVHNAVSSFSLSCLNLGQTSVCMHELNFKKNNLFF